MMRRQWPPSPYYRSKEHYFHPFHRPSMCVADVCVGSRYGEREECPIWLGFFTSSPTQAYLCVQPLDPDMVERRDARSTITFGLWRLSLDQRWLALMKWRGGGSPLGHHHDSWRWRRRLWRVPSADRFGGWPGDWGEGTPAVGDGAADGRGWGENGWGWGLCGVVAWSLERQGWLTLAAPLLCACGDSAPLLGRVKGHKPTMA